MTPAPADRAPGEPTPELPPGYHLGPADWDGSRNVYCGNRAISQREKRSADVAWAHYGRACYAAPAPQDVEAAARCWCDPTTSHIEMDVVLATVFARALASTRLAAERERDEARGIAQACERRAEAAEARAKELSQLRYEDAKACVGHAKRISVLEAERDGAEARAAKLAEILQQAVDADALAEWFTDTEHDGVDARAALAFTGKEGRQ
jgi:hypothetical protein